MKIAKQSVVASHGGVNVWVGGTGPDVLAIHGLGGSGRYWHGLTSAIGSSFTVRAVDLPGFGRSPAPNHLDRSTHLAALDAATTELDRPVHIVCHSIGGVLGALWASLNPDRVASLYLAASPFPDPNPRFSVGGPGYSPPRVARFAAGALRTVWPAISIPIAASRGYPLAVVRDFGRQSVRARIATLWSLLYDPALRDAIDFGSLRDVPCHIDHAGDDRTVPVRDQQRWLDAIPGAAHAIHKTGAHQFLLTQNFAPAIRWLTNQP
jgi:pimeloyl-ACP methyl ester carboxylesterase